MRRVLRPGVHLFLATLLLFSQQQAVVHLLGHGLAQLSQRDAPDPAEPICAKCLAIAHLDHAISADLPTFPPVPLRFPIADAAVALATDVAFVAHYRSRAPPVLA